MNDSDIYSGPYRGMGKEELLKHSSKPLWRRLRMICISIVLLGWLALIITVVALVLIYPRCRPADSRAWWQKEVIYRIYVPSFKDSSGDGIGDLAGIESKLDYIKDLGFETISLSPFYRTDKTDSDFNILNHTEVDSQYGKLDDFKSLVKAVHNRDMHLILDFIPNHTSDKHTWFISSGVSPKRSNDKRNYYVWIDGPVSNWKSVYGNSSWEQIHWGRNQHYLHQFLTTQPELNLRSSQVQDELEKILRYWLELGVDGFNIRNSAFLFEDYDIRDEPKTKEENVTQNPEDYEYYEHKYTFNLPEVHDMLARWRTLLVEFGKLNNTEKFMMADIKGDINTAMGYYGLFDRDGVHVTTNLYFAEEEITCNGDCIARYVGSWMDNLPDGRWASWMAGYEDSRRFGSRFNETYMKAFNLLIMLLPGTPVVYYGDEIKMIDLPDVTSPGPWSKTQIMRGLMQWENVTNGGFQTDASCDISGCNEPWIDVNKDFSQNNAMIQNTTAGSLLNFMKNLTRLRKENSFIIGEYHPTLYNENIFSFVREFDGEKGYLIAINFGQATETNDFTGTHSTIKTTATVELTTGNDVGYKVGSDISTESITLQSHQGIVVSWNYAAKEL